MPLMPLNYTALDTVSSFAGRSQLPSLIAERRVRWRDFPVSPDEFLSACDAEDVAPLVHLRIAESDDAGEWPLVVRDALADRARAAAAEELLRAAEARAVIEALADADVQAILIKGTAVAYTVYPMPACRPRSDTDLLIPAASIDDARRVLASLGYTAAVHCSELFRQFEMQKTDRFGVTHAFDVHWKISTQPAFAHTLIYEDVRSRTVPVPALGRAAHTLSTTDALMLACIHPVMHHRNAVRLLWAYDIHLLASSLSPSAMAAFAERARERSVAAVCGYQLRLARTLFGTHIEPRPLTTLAEVEAIEPSAAYLTSERRWHDETLSSARGLPRVGDRLKLAREILFPRPAYMFGAYGLHGKPLAPWLLPALYVHRNMRGAWRILTGKK
jgi:hypothetical protein